MKTAMRILFIGLVLGVAGYVAAAQVKYATIGGGFGTTASGNQAVMLLVGETAVGFTDSTTPSASLGLFEIFRRSYVVSPAVDDLPGAGTTLGRAWPNPFNPSTRINFALDRASDVRIDAYDLRGRRVAVLLREVRPPGTHTITWEPRNLPSGAYLILMRADGYEASRRVMLVK